MAEYGYGYKANDALIRFKKQYKASYMALMAELDKELTCKDFKAAALELQTDMSELNRRLYMDFEKRDAYNKELLEAIMHYVESCDSYRDALSNVGLDFFKHVSTVLLDMTERMIDEKIKDMETDALYEYEDEEVVGVDSGCTRWLGYDDDDDEDEEDPVDIDEKILREFKERLRDK